MFSSKNRFHRRKHIEQIMRRGESVRGRSVGLKYTTQQADTFTVAVVVSKKVSKSAVTRNKIRRRIYAAVKNNQDLIKPGFKGVFTGFDEDLKGVAFSEIENEVKTLLNKVK